MIMHNNNGYNGYNGYNCYNGYNNGCSPFATKGLANGLGIPALALSVISLLGNCGNGTFGGGCNNGYQNAVVAENAELKAIINTKEEVAKLKEDLLTKYFKPIADEVAENKTNVAVLRKDLECCCTANATAISGVAKILNGITATVIPNQAICPGWGPVLTSQITTDPKATATNVVGTIGQKTV